MDGDSTSITTQPPPRFRCQAGRREHRVLWCGPAVHQNLGQRREEAHTATWGSVGATDCKPCPTCALADLAPAALGPGLS